MKFSEKFSNLLKEWDYEKNLINPSELSYGSSKEVWWKCNNGHSWKTPLSRRTTSQKSGCPYCSNQKLLIGYNDLETKFPELMEEWDYEKNESLPSEYLYGSSKKVWWKCCKCGNKWQSTIINRTGKNKCGCPKCGLHKFRQTQLKNQIKREGSLADNYPDLMLEWNYEKNVIDPKTLVSGSAFKAWWKCSKCGNEWQAIVVSRTRGSGCPYCNHHYVMSGFNDVKTLYPELIEEWDYDKNSKLGLDPNKLISHSLKKAYWICPNCNESYQATISNRVNGTGCPICANEYKTSFPEQTIYYYMKQIFSESVNRWNKLGVEVDIYIPTLKLGIEYDGSLYHKSKESLKREKNKFLKLKDYGISLIRIRERDLVDESYADYIIKLEKKNNDSELESAIELILKYVNDNYKIDSKIDINIKRDRYKIYNVFIRQIKENNIETLYPNICKYWDYEKNGRLLPKMFTSGSERKVWWKCKNGHEYESAIHNRCLNNAGCPYCAHQKVLTGENDLETLYPMIAKEWDYEKNKVKPSEILPFSNKKYYWKCPKGHSYKCSSDSRVRKDTPRGCPICSGHQILKGYNDIESQYPELMKEWDYKKNNKLELYPDKITKGSNKKAWWKCDKNHSWSATIHSRVAGVGCPVCAGKTVLIGYNDLESSFPELIKEWSYDKNKVSPDKVIVGFQKKYWWRCSKCGNEWETTPYLRTHGQDCPKCKFKKSGKKIHNTILTRRGSLKDNCPELMKEWDYQKNLEIGLTPDMVTKGTHTHVYWKCSNGHSWSAEVKSRTRGRGCPICAGKRNYQK